MEKKKTPVGLFMDNLMDYKYSEEDSMYIIKIPKHILIQKYYEVKEIEKEMIIKYQTQILQNHLTDESAKYYAEKHYNEIYY